MFQLHFFVGTCLVLYQRNLVYFVDLFQNLQIKISKICKILMLFLTFNLYFSESQKKIIQYTLLTFLFLIFFFIFVSFLNNINQLSTSIKIHSQLSLLLKFNPSYIVTMEHSDLPRPGRRLGEVTAKHQSSAEEDLQ